MKSAFVWFAVAVVACGLSGSSFGAQPEILYLGNDGRIVWSNSLASGVAAIEFAHSPPGPWTNDWRIVVPITGPVMTNRIPLYFRVVNIPDCDDGNACTADARDPESGECVYTLIVCDDFDPCTFDECIPELGCVHVVRDEDMDGVPTDCDNCPDVVNPEQEDRDSDGVGDLCDNCPDTPNPGQEDNNYNGIGDACEGLTCSAQESLFCGSDLSSTTVGQPSVINNYSCTGWLESGPERAFSFVTTNSVPVTVRLSNLTAGQDLDVFVLRDECNAVQCVANGDVEAGFTPDAFVTYYIVVDGYQGAEGAFDIQLTCSP